MLDQVIPPAEPVPAGGTCQQGNPPESAHVKQVKIKSALFSAFWGRPIYIAASVLLPRDYDARAAARFPAVYQWGHYPTAYNPVGNPNPFGFTESGANAFSQWWTAAGTPQVIAVNFRHENAFYDSLLRRQLAQRRPLRRRPHQGADGDDRRALPHRGRTWARTSTGASTGGWQALAQQVYYPDVWGGTFACARTSSTSAACTRHRLYADENLYFKNYEWNQVPRPHSARPTAASS